MTNNDYGLNQVLSLSRIEKDGLSKVNQTEDHVTDEARQLYLPSQSSSSTPPTQSSSPSQSQFEGIQRFGHLNKFSPHQPARIHFSHDKIQIFYLICQSDKPFRI